MKGMTKAQCKVLCGYVNGPFAVRNLSIVEDNLIMLVQTGKGFQDVIVSPEGRLRPIEHKQT